MTVTAGLGFSATAGAGLGFSTDGFGAIGGDGLIATARGGGAAGGATTAAGGGGCTGSGTGSGAGVAHACNTKSIGSRSFFKRGFSTREWRQIPALGLKRAHRGIC